MCEVYVKVAGNWEQVTEIYVQVGGTWQLLTEAWQKVDEAWRIFWQPNGFVPFTQTFHEPNRTWEDYVLSGYVYTPCGATNLIIEQWGGGGSGGAKFVGQGSNSIAGSGGGGQYLITSSYAVAPNEKFNFSIGGQVPPGSNQNPSPFYNFPNFTQIGESGLSPVIYPDDFRFFEAAVGGNGGLQSIDGAGGDNISDPSNPDNGSPAAWQPASGFGGDGGGPSGGAGGQVNPFVAPTFPGGGGPGGFNGSDGHFGVTPVMYLHWS